MALETWEGVAVLAVMEVMKVAMVMVMRTTTDY